MNTLRGRLLGSYVLVIGLSLAVVAIALFLLLRNNPLPERQALQRLTDIARATTPRLGPAADRDTEAVFAQLGEIAETNDIRTMVVSVDGAVLFDSANSFQPGSTLDLPIESRLQRGGQGRFTDPDGSQWLYVATGMGGQFGQRLGQGERMGMGQAADGAAILYASPRSRLPALLILGVNLFRPLLQAGLIALIVSIVLAALISGSVARPLQRIAEAATGVARGDYSQKATVAGPKEVRRLARSFNYMSEQVKKSQETQRDFLANVSHELKTPLTSIQGFSQAILDGAEQDPARAARVIHDEAGRMRRMVEELLDLARIESGQVAMARQRVDLTAILNAVVERLSLRAEESNVQIVTRLQPLPGLTGDGDRLAQVFTNLIDNALDHTPHGGTVTVSAAPKDSSVQVAVSDTGEGIPGEDLGRIFERFYQVDKSRARGAAGRRGAGLGLTITKEIVEAHGGSIRAESRNGQGATFRVWLPLPGADDATVARLRRS